MTMFIYELLHRHDGGNLKSLGHFSTPEKARAAIAESCVLPGFRDHPEGYYIVPRAVSGSEPENGTVYQAWVWIHDDAFEEEDWHILGFFGGKEAAERAVNAWKMRKPQESLQGLCFEAACESVLLDRLQWPEGYTEETHSS